MLMLPTAVILIMKALPVQHPFRCFLNDLQGTFDLVRMERHQTMEMKIVKFIRCSIGDLGITKISRQQDLRQLLLKVRLAAPIPVGKPTDAVDEEVRFVQLACEVLIRTMIVKMVLHSS